MSSATSIDLGRLPALAEMFAHLSAGKHLNRLANHRLWAELEREEASYLALFDALGFDLRIDGRGFAWFQVDEATSTVSKTTRQLALLFMLIFEHQADAGMQLARFTDWIIDAALLAAVVEKHAMLLDAENLAIADLQQLLKSAANYGFVVPDGAGWQLLPAVFRYLDRFEELAHREATRHDTLLDAEDALEPDAEADDDEAAP